MLATMPSELNSPQLPLLDGCDADARAAFGRLIEKRTFAAGQNILDEDGTDQSLWVLLEGTCEVVKRGNGHGSQQLAVLEPGSAFGEMSFLRPAPHSATVRALANVRVGRLTPAAFEKLRDESPAAAFAVVMNLVTLLSERLRKMDERVCDLVDGSGEPQSKEWHDFRARLFAGWDFN